MFAFGLVVAQEEGTTYYPTVYEYPNGNTMTNDIKLNTYYFYVYELLPLNADGEWGFIAFKQEGGIKGRGYLDIDIQGMRVVGYPDYMDTYEQKAAYYDEIFYYWYDQGFSPQRAKSLADNEIAPEGRPVREDFESQEEKENFIRRVTVEWIRKGFSHEQASEFAEAEAGGTVDGEDDDERRGEGDDDGEDEDGEDEDGEDEDGEDDDANMNDSSNFLRQDVNPLSSQQDGDNDNEDGEDDQDDDDQDNDAGDATRRNAENDNQEDEEDEEEDAVRREAEQGDDVELVFEFDLTTLKGRDEYNQIVREIRGDVTTPKVRSVYYRIDSASFYMLENGTVDNEPYFHLTDLGYIEVEQSVDNFMGALIRTTYMMDIENQEEDEEAFENRNYSNWNCQCSCL